jgi:hypothetical protein
VLAGDELVDGGVDGRVLPADAEAGQEPEQEEPPRAEGERRGQRRQQVHDERDDEEFLAAESVGQPPEEQRSHAGARDIEGGGEARHLLLGDVEAAAGFGELRGQVADDGDFETVEDPDGAEPDDDHPVPA